MKGTLKLEDGREFAVELGDKALDHLEEPKKIGYERVKIGETYYYDYGGGVNWDKESSYAFDNCNYNNANYYSDRTVAENNVRADTLMRKLRRFAVEHREKNRDWNDDSQSKFEIYYYHKDQTIKTSPYQNCQGFGTIYFDTQKTAKAAIEEFKDELIWYFTEYKDSL